MFALKRARHPICPNRFERSTDFFLTAIFATCLPTRTIKSMKKINNETTAAIICLIFIAIFVAVFHGVIFSSDQFAFRDAGHYYYPLYNYLSETFNPTSLFDTLAYENDGFTPSADSSSALFYPGKLIFSLPLGFSTDFKIYILAHYLLAMAGLYWLARRLIGCESIPSAIGAIAYGYSGYLLFQHTNLIYLVGAAWIPWALFFGAAALRSGSRLNAVGFGLTLAMIVLGGDPQAAYNTILVVGGLALLLLWRRRRGARRFGGPMIKQSIKRPWKKRLSRPGPVQIFLIAGGVSFVVSAIQVIPSICMTPDSFRAEHQTARSIYEIPATIRQAKLDQVDTTWRVLDGLLCRRYPADGHHSLVYRFSFKATYLPELIWPNFSGQSFPTNRRWLNAFAPEGRIWVPSIYLGLVPLVLSLVALKFRKSRWPVVWFSWLGLISLLAAFGNYGLGWFLERFGRFFGADTLWWILGAPVGGPYWLMTVLMPGYIYFRYPAKWLVFFTAAIAILAASGANSLLRDSRSVRRIQIVLSGLVALSLAGLLLLWIGENRWNDLLTDVAPNRLFGPIDSSAARFDLMVATAHTATIGIGSIFLIGLLSKGQTKPKRRSLLLGLFLLTAFDLGWAAAPMIKTAPISCWTAPSRFAEKILSDATDRGLDRSDIRIYREPSFYPERWSHESSPDRLAANIRWDHDTLQPKHNWFDRLTIVNVYGSTMRAEYHEILATSKIGPIMQKLNANYAILPDSSDPNDDYPESLWEPIDQCEGARLWYRCPKPIAERAKSR
jgi:hypothetical protein